MGDLRTSQPGKALWVLAALWLNAIRLPLWLIYYIPSSTRPNPDWTYRQAVRVRIVRAFLWNAAVIEMRTPLSLEPGKEGNRFVVMEPAKSSYYVGVTTVDPQIKPQKIGGTWYPQLLGSKSEKTGYVVLHFHGGAYAIGDGREHDAGFAAKTMLTHGGVSHVFCPQYRLSSNKLGRFPAQLQDAVTSYVYLVDNLGIDPKKIVVSGDSAGANLVLALLRYLADHGSKVGLTTPVVAWLYSPWVNPEMSIRLGAPAISQNPRYPTDYLSGEFGLWGAKYLHPEKSTGLTINDKYISFAGSAFKTGVPIFIQTGSAEVLYDDNYHLAEEFKEIEGNQVKLCVIKNAVHDIILTGKIMAFEDEAANAAQEAGAFLKTHAKN